MASRRIACSVAASTLGGALLAALFALALAVPLWAKTDHAGVAWNVQGNWLAGDSGVPIHTGDAIQPASLLRPGDDAGTHSILVLLPDGQRVLYECFTAADCARGFRVPALTHQPGPFALQILARIRAGVALRQNPSSATSSDHAVSNPALRASRDEAVAVIDRTHRVHLAGLIASLPAGRYTYNLQPHNHALAPQYHQALEKNSSAIAISVPAPGLYQLTIADALNTPRVDLFFAAVEPTQVAHFASFNRTQDTLEDWNGDYQGWPVDELLRAYLEWLMHTSPSSLRGHAHATAQASASPSLH